MKFSIILFAALSAAQGLRNGGFDNSASTIAPWTPERLIAQPGNNGSPNSVRLPVGRASISQSVGNLGGYYRLSFAYLPRSVNGSVTISVTSNGPLTQTTTSTVAYNNTRSFPTSNTGTWVTVDDYIQLNFGGNNVYTITISSNTVGLGNLGIDSVTLTPASGTFAASGTPATLQNAGFETGNLIPWRGTGQVVNIGQSSSGDPEYAAIPTQILQNVTLVVGRLYEIRFDYQLTFYDSSCQFLSIEVGFGAFDNFVTRYGIQFASSQNIVFRQYVIAQPGPTSLFINAVAATKPGGTCGYLARYRIDNVSITPATYTA